MLKYVREIIKPLHERPIQAYFSDKFQLYHLLEFILEQTGPATLTISTFSVSEEFIRKLQQFREKGLITNLTIIADQRTAVKALRLSLFTNNISEELLLGNNHAKLILFSNSEWNVSLVTSQNQTRGNRIECGMLCTFKDIYISLLEQVSEESKNFTKANDIFQ